MLGINGSEFIVLLAVAVVVIGPERLPRYAQQLAQLISELRKMAAVAQEKVREEMGPEFDDVDWRALDLRQYDPRRIVREALTDVVDLNDPLGLGQDPLGFKGVSPGGPTSTGPTASTSSQGPVAASASRSEPVDEDAGPVFDPDAT